MSIFIFIITLASVIIILDALLEPIFLIAEDGGPTNILVN